MTPAVLCLRPWADFERAGALPPPSLEVTYRAPGDADVPALMKATRALVMPVITDNLSGLDGLLVGVVGLGTIGLASAEAFHHMGCRICFHDPAPANPTAARALGAESMSLVDELALAAHLRAGQLGGAAIDVYASEPPGADHALLALDGEAARAVHAAHCRRDAPISRLPVPVRVAQRRAGSHRRRGAVEPGVLTRGEED